MCWNMCMWNDSGMVGKHVVGAFLSKWHSADLPLKIHNNSFLHFLAQWQGYQKSFIKNSSQKRLSFALIKVHEGNRMLWHHTTLNKGWGCVCCRPFYINKISSMVLQTFVALTSSSHVQWNRWYYEEIEQNVKVKSSKKTSVAMKYLCCTLISKKAFGCHSPERTHFAI